MPTPITPSLQENQRRMDAALHRDINPDMHVRHFFVFGQQASLYFAEGLCSAEQLQHYILAPMAELCNAPALRDLKEELRRCVPGASMAAADTVEEAVRQTLKGNAVVFVDGMQGAQCYDVRSFVRRGISPPRTEQVVLGPHEGFNESLRDCITLLRRILPTPDLIGEMRAIGDRYPLGLCVMYLHGVADEATLSRIRARLEGIHVDHVLSIGALQQLMEDRPFALLPQCILTERPDRAASMLLEGQIVLLLDGSSQALVLPASIWHLLHTPDDTSARFQYGSFMRLIRLMGLLCALLLPGLFVAFVTFHPEALPVTLLTSILESQASVPFSIPVEALVMLVMFNLIGEAATRVPAIVGGTLGTVSGLILGTAAVDAHLVHPLLLIVVAVASLGSYAVPDYSLGIALRIGQLLMVLAGSIFGVYGMVLFIAAGTVRLCSLTSLGSPFAAPYAPARGHNPDGVIRGPLMRQRWRTWLSAPHDRQRARGPMRRWDRRRE
ncbi:MAG: spore germination protein [Clostridiales bacterium]|nr:spore germination protein [Clostridiales bacterium]